MKRLDILKFGIGLAPPDEDKDRLARHFSVPEYSLESWIHKLIDVDKVRSIRGVHFREYT